MSAYPWMKRHKRYLSFRYIFPEIAAGWIQFKRFLLRVLWFFTHPIDEFLDDIRDAMLWPFAVLNTLWRWLIIGIHEFLSDLVRGIETAFGWLGGLPVWTGAAVSGVMGIILTILLFLMPAITTAVPASIPPPAQPAATTQGIATLEILPAFDLSQPAPKEPEFDPFETPAGRQQVFPQSNLNLSLPELQMQLANLMLPAGWSSRQQISVVSTPTRIDVQELARRFGQSAIYDQWGQPRLDRIQRALNFTPYASRVGVRSTIEAPSWIQPESIVEPLDQFSTQRHPSVVIEKTIPGHAPVGQPLQYTLNVKNVGEETLDSVTVREQLSEIQRVSSTSPPAKVIGESLVWDLSELRPGERRQLQIEMQPNSEVLLTHKSAVQVTTRVAAVSNVRAPRPEPPPVALEPEPEPEPPASAIPQFFDEPEPMPLPQPEAEPVDQEPLPEVIPFEEEPAEEFMPQFEPEPVRIEEPVQPLSLEMFAPQAVASGADVKTVFEVQNRGGDDIENLVLAVELTDELDHPNGHTLELKIPRISAGEVFRTRLTTEAVKNGTATLSSKVTSRAAETVSATQEVRISDDVSPSPDVVYEMFPECPPFPCGRPLF
ncbi:MAG: hypothetical protein KDA86_06090 [Planctomycetaceae bacterium]|nr:hypothetical protein [Planctomycetaceae bacterium]